MRRMFRWGIPIVAILLLAVYAVASYMIAAGVTKAERKEQEDHPAAYGLQFEEVEFSPRKGDLTLNGWFIPGGGAGPTLVFVHGIGSMRTGDNATELAARMVEKGFGVLMFDLRAHGSSEGDRISGGFHELYDVLGAFDFLVDRGVEPDRIGVWSVSMGAGTSALALAEETAIRALVLDSTYASASELIAQETARKTVFPKWIVPIFVPGAGLAADLLFGIDLGLLVPEKAVANLGFPIMVIHGKADARIPYDHGVRVHGAADRESILWLLPDVEHVDAFITYPDEYANRVSSYFISRLAAPSPE